MAKAVNTTITNCGNEATINVTNKNAKTLPESQDILKIQPLQTVIM